MASNSNNQSRRAAESKAQPRAKKKRGRGKPPYEPTEESRRVVELMAAHAIKHDDICRAIDPPCSAVTLRKAYATELARARSRYKGTIARSIHMWLVGRPAAYDDQGRVVQEEVKPDRSMAIFQAKVVLGQRERLEVTGKGGAPLFDPELLRNLSDRELAEFERLTAKLAAASSRADGDQGGEDATRH